MCFGFWQAGLQPEPSPRLTPGYAAELGCQNTQQSEIGPYYTSGTVAMLVSFLAHRQWGTARVRELWAT